MMHKSTYDFITPTRVQLDKMNRVQRAALALSDVLEGELVPDSELWKILHDLRTLTMWARESIMRWPDGRPRTEWQSTSPEAG